MHSRLRPPSLRTSHIDATSTRRSDERFTWIVITTLVFGIIIWVTAMVMAAAS